MHDECTKKSKSTIQFVRIYNHDVIQQSEARKCSGIYYQKPIVSVHVNRKTGMQKTDGIKLQ